MITSTKSQFIGRIDRVIFEDECGYGLPPAAIFAAITYISTILLSATRLT